MSSTRVAIIGAGPSGLSQLHAFATAQQKGALIPDVVCFEKQADWGGLWNYTWRTGLDEHGEPCHGSMYRHLWSNAPKECFEYPDYTFQEHFGKATSSFPTRAVLEGYIKGRVEKSGVRKWIRFRSVVRMVEYSDESGTFTVTVHDFAADRTYSDKFNNVVIATGHFSFPHLPHFDGIDHFSGRVLHSHDFRNAREFKGQNVLVIGRHYSAEDIASQCHKYGAKSVTISYRSKLTGLKWPESIKEVPLLQSISNGNTCHFLDGSSRQIDAIILCTGHIHNFPFLPDNLRLKTENRLWPLKLYKGVVWEDYPGLFYLGMQDQCFSLTMFDVQAWFVRDVIMERIQLPTTELMTADSLKYREKEENLQTDMDYVTFQSKYVQELMELTDYWAIHVDAVVEVFRKWLADKKGDIMKFRDIGYESTLTGQKGTEPDVTWLDQMEDEG